MKPDTNKPSVILGGKEYFWDIKDIKAIDGSDVWQRTLKTDLATFKFRMGRLIVEKPKEPLGTFETDQPMYRRMDDINKEVTKTYNRLASGEDS